jgi:hypothetical protein
LLQDSLWTLALQSQPHQEFLNISRVQCQWHPSLTRQQLSRISMTIQVAKPGGIDSAGSMTIHVTKPGDVRGLEIGK